MKRYDKVKYSPVTVSIKLLVKFIGIATDKGYITKEQSQDVLEEMCISVGIKI